MKTRFETFLSTKHANRRLSEKIEEKIIPKPQEDASCRALESCKTLKSGKLQDAFIYYD